MCYLDVSSKASQPVFWCNIKKSRKIPKTVAMHIEDMYQRVEACITCSRLEACVVPEQSAQPAVGLKQNYQLKN